MVDAPTARVQWPRYHRLINSAYPPIDLFEDIADPSDWGLLGGAEARTNPRLADTIGNLDLIPIERRVGGAGASYVMAPFTHISPEKTGRFNDGSFGVFYAGDSFETALFETVHHMQVFYAATNEDKGWLTDFREVVGNVDAVMTDITSSDFADLMNPDDYTASQAFATKVKAAGSNGILYPSVRYLGGMCFGTFYPDVMSIPTQAKHVRYHWDGDKINMIKHLDEGLIFEIEN